MSKSHELDYRYHRGEWRWFVKSCVTRRFRLGDETISNGVTVKCTSCANVVYSSKD